MRLLHPDGACSMTCLLPASGAVKEGCWVPLLHPQWCVQHYKPLDDHAAMLGLETGLMCRLL